MLSAYALSQTAKGVFEHGRKSTAAHLTRTLRQRAHEAGWPSHVYGGITVHANEDGFRVHLADHIEEHAMDLEYGTQQSPPNAVLRRFGNRLDELADAHMAERLLEATE